MRRRLITTFTLAMFIVMLALMLLNMEVSGGFRGEIDLYTNKTPYDGRGLNQQSDAFQPQELVELYARVTYNEGVVAHCLVAFQVLDPLSETVAVGVNWTDNDGVASFNFRIPWPSEDLEWKIFGYWKAVATVRIADKVLMDTLTFQVGWIVQVTNIKTLNANFIPQAAFLRGETVVFNLTVRNIALTCKPAIVIVDVFDVINCPIIHAAYEKPVVFQPGESFVQIISKVPVNATIGRAIVSAVTYTALPEYGGVAYSPPCISHFDVILPPKVQYYLTVKTEPLGIVFIPGEGWYDEGASISLTAPNSVPISIGTRYKFKYWNVDGVALTGNTIIVVMDRNHTATAYYALQYYLTVISPYGVADGEGWYDADEMAYASLNVGVFDSGNGTRRVFVSWGGDASGVSYSRSNPIIMDRPKIAIANWKTQFLLTVATDPAGLQPQPSRSPFGEAGPAGSWWYDARVNVSLVAQPVAEYDFSHWDVDGKAFEVGMYAVTICMNGPHRATAHYSVRVAGLFVLEWFYWILLLILVLIIILLCLWIYRRRRRAKTGEAAFRRGWTAWYYGYDLLGRSRFK
ncbi:MAG: hypothetical protein QXJ77_01220 [Candidatus Bathyarchaeia archaeon]